jgi:hypothetical protein
VQKIICNNNFKNRQYLSTSDDESHECETANDAEHGWNGSTATDESNGPKSATANESNDTKSTAANESATAPTNESDGHESTTAKSTAAVVF